MGVDQRVEVGTAVKDPQVEGQLAGGFPPSGAYSVRPSMVTMQTLSNVISPCRPWWG
jgi:hypothetical protein